MRRKWFSCCVTATSLGATGFASAFRDSRETTGTGKASGTQSQDDIVTEHLGLSYFGPSLIRIEGFSEWASR